MTHDDDARVADLLARLGDGDSKELFRRCSRPACRS
jgi:putative transposase